MTTTFATATPSLTDRVSGVVGALRRQLSAARARRAQRLALAALLDFDAARLDDLGISYQDVAEALHARGKPSH
jgi:uncharacterized protein YjiS (DUF1127 family)